MIHRIHMHIFLSIHIYFITNTGDTDLAHDVFRAHYFFVTLIFFSYSPGNCAPPINKKKQKSPELRLNFGALFSVHIFTGTFLALSPATV